MESEFGHVRSPLVIHFFVFDLSDFKPSQTISRLVVPSNKLLSELQIKHPIQQAKYTEDHKVNPVLVNYREPDKLAHVTRFGKWIEEYVVNAVSQWVGKNKKYECDNHNYNGGSVAILDQGR